VDTVTICQLPRFKGQNTQVDSWVQSVAAVCSEYVLLTDGTLTVETSVIEALADAFSDFEFVGMVGPKIISDSGVLVRLSTNDDHNKFNVPALVCTDYDLVDSTFTYQVSSLSVSLVMIRREVWRGLNLFGDVYHFWDHLDVHLSLRVREMGYKCLYVPSIQVHYANQRLDPLLGKRSRGHIAKINLLKLKARWHKATIRKINTSAAAILNGVDSETKSCLFLDFATPQFDSNAGGYAAIKEMQVLQSLGYQITFIPKNMENAGPYTDALQRMGIECIYAPLYGDIDEFLSKRGSEFSLIYITRYHVAHDVLLKLRQYASTAKIILMLADLHFLRELRAALYNNNDEQLSQAMETRENELAVMRKVDLVLSYSDVEKTVILSHNLASTKVAKCPWVCDVVESVSGFENRVDIAFLGGFNHRPNVEAMVWFIEQVWPDLLAQLPEAQLRIYGSAIPQAIKDLAAAKARIQVHGWVGDVASVYNSCRVFIAPLQSGAGIKGKVIGALAHGVPSVLSDIAVEGIGVCDEIHAFVASSLDQWVNRIMTLYTDQALWEQMSQHALSFAKRNYSLDKAIVDMKAALSTAGIEPILEPKALVWKGPWRSVAQV
jgi:O-antigen biosynthesis protein